MNPAILSGLAGSPLVKVAAKYWWLAIPSGFAMWTLMRKRDKIDAAAVIQDFGTCFGPVIPLIVLCEMVADRQASAPAAPVAGLALQGPIREADFSVKTPQFPLAGGV